jgi:RHS repeat-associated protein
VITYAYDGLQRLTGADESPGASYAYGYDDAGNRTGVWLNGTRTVTQTFNAANQVAGFSYDEAGNLTNDGTATYAYDALGRMIVRSTTPYTYTGDGVLVDDGTTRYTQDLAAPLSQILQTTQGSTTTNYLYGLERLAAQAGSAKTWYVGDGLGSVRLTLDDAGAPLGLVNYDPWGTPESGSVPTFGFTGERQDAATGLVNLRARWYSTAQGRFVSRDPFAGLMEQPTTLHPYLYVGNSPINLTDPSGKCFPPIEYLRRLEPLNCANLDAAGQIFHHPNANMWERGQALAYVTAWTAGHVCAIVGVSILTVEAGTVIASGSALVRLRAAAAAVPAVMRWFQQSIQRSPSVWQSPPFQRGVEIEERIGHNVPPSFPTIDRWNPATGEAASIKSIDLLAKTYQNTSTLTRTVTGYINKVANYGGQQPGWAGLEIRLTAIRSRVLDLAIPASGATPDQMSKLQSLQQYAQTVNVTLNIHLIP